MPELTVPEWHEVQVVSPGAPVLEAGGWLENEKANSEKTRRSKVEARKADSVFIRFMLNEEN